MDLALALVLKITPPKIALKMAPALALTLKMALVLALVLALKMALALALAVAPASPQASWRRLRLGECASVLAWCVCCVCSVELKMRVCGTSPTSPIIGDFFLCLATKKLVDLHTNKSRDQA